MTILTDIKTAIDDGDLATLQTKIQDLHDRGKLRDLCSFTASGLDALQYALIPPKGKSVNQEVVLELLSLVQNDGAPLFDLQFNTHLGYLTFRLIEATGNESISAAYRQTENHVHREAIN